MASSARQLLAAAYRELSKERAEPEARKVEELRSAPSGGAGQVLTRCAACCAARPAGALRL